MDSADKGLDLLGLRGGLQYVTQWIYVVPFFLEGQFQYSVAKMLRLLHIIDG
jgi:hypothetical protein